jgi:hypothetical protein
MEHKIHTTADHHGAEIYERWTFPQPKNRNHPVKLEVLGADLTGDVVSVTEMELKDVPHRAAEKYLNGLTSVRDSLNRVIDDLEAVHDVDGAVEEVEM